MLGSLFSALQGRDDRAESERKPHRHLAVTAEGLREMLRRNWHLPFTSFGGPAVHFQIFHRLFVDKYHWMDERTYQEMFALCQALSGPGSTKMLYAINVLRHGFFTGVLAFFLWSLPTAIGTFGLALGVSRIGETLPGPVYALLSGLNSATVGIIFLAAVQLSNKAITDKVTRILVFFGAAAGVLYNALWYFPILMLVGAIVTAVWDYRWGHRFVNSIRDRFKKDSPQQDVDTERQATSSSRDGEEMQDAPRGNEKSPVQGHDSSGLRRVGPGGTREGTDPTNENAPVNSEPESAARNRATETAAAAEEPETDVSVGAFSLKVGISVGVGFFLVFVAVMVLRALLDPQPRWYGIFANHFLAGTIIFGGGPVVIPLLREYVVVPGWVTPRDFLLGLAIIQAFPGPNFNFAVYLGGLAAISGGESAALGSALAYVGIFTPGLVLHTAVMGIWAPLRRKSHKAVFSVLRGVNATAVGLIYTAVYRLWEAGYLDAAGGSSNTGRSLGADPWWIVVTATAFIGGMYFKVPAPAAIVLGAIMGLICKQELASIDYRTRPLSILVAYVTQGRAFVIRAVNNRTRRGLHRRHRDVQVFHTRDNHSYRRLVDMMPSNHHFPAGLSRRPRSDSNTSNESAESRRKRAAASHIDRLRRRTGERRNGGTRAPASEDVFLAIAQEESVPEENRSATPRAAAKNMPAELDRRPVHQPAAAVQVSEPAQLAPPPSSRAEERLRQFKLRRVSHEQEQRRRQQERQLGLSPRRLSGSAASGSSDEAARARPRGDSSASGRSLSASRTAEERLRNFKLRRASQPALSREDRRDGPRFLKTRSRQTTAGPATISASGHRGLHTVEGSGDDDDVATTAKATAPESAVLTLWSKTSAADRTMSNTIKHCTLALRHHKGQLAPLTHEHDYDSSLVVARRHESSKLLALPGKNDGRSRRHQQQQQQQQQNTRGRSNSAGSSSDSSRAWDELQSLKARLRQLERTTAQTPLPSSNPSSRHHLSSPLSRRRASHHVDDGGASLQGSDRVFGAVDTLRAGGSSKTAGTMTTTTTTTTTRFKSGRSRSRSGSSSSSGSRRYHSPKDSSGAAAAASSSTDSSTRHVRVFGPSRGTVARVDLAAARRSGYTAATTTTTTADIPVVAVDSTSIDATANGNATMTLARSARKPPPPPPPPPPMTTTTGLSNAHLDVINKYRLPSSSLMSGSIPGIPGIPGLHRETNASLNSLSNLTNLAVPFSENPDHPPTDSRVSLTHALAKARPYVARGVFLALESAVADVLSLANTVNPNPAAAAAEPDVAERPSSSSRSSVLQQQQQHEKVYGGGPPPANSLALSPGISRSARDQGVSGVTSRRAISVSVSATPTPSSSSSSSSSLSERILRRKADDVCRRLTDLCLALTGVGAGAGAGVEVGRRPSSASAAIATITGTGTGIAPSSSSSFASFSAAGDGGGGRTEGRTVGRTVGRTAGRHARVPATESSALVGPFTPTATSDMVSSAQKLAGRAALH